MILILPHPCQLKYYIYFINYLRDYSVTNKSYKFRPPPACLFNSAPPTTKDQLGPPDSCTSLPLWLTQLGFSSFILKPILTLLLSCLKQTIHPASRPVKELTLGPPALSQTLNGNLLFLRLNSIPADASRSGEHQRLLAPRTLGEVTPSSTGSVPLFLTAYRKIIKETVIIMQ